MDPIFFKSLEGAHALNLAQGHTGAQNILARLLKEGVVDELNKMERNKIVGPRLWQLYKDNFQEDLKVFRQYINNNLK
jgi:hypothetical protein